MGPTTPRLLRACLPANSSTCRFAGAAALQPLRTLGLFCCPPALIMPARLLRSLFNSINALFNSINACCLALALAPPTHLQVPEVHVTARAFLPSTSVISFTLGAGLSFTTFVNTVPVSANKTGEGVGLCCACSIWLLE